MPSVDDFVAEKAQDFNSAQQDLFARRKRFNRNHLQPARNCSFQDGLESVLQAGVTGSIPVTSTNPYGTVSPDGASVGEPNFARLVPPVAGHLSLINTLYSN